MPVVNNEILRHIRLIALDNCDSQSIEWFVERAFRYYSKTYHTPLHIVRSLDILDVLKVYMEDECVDMSPEDRQAMKDRILIKPRPMLDIKDYEQEQYDEMDDEEWVQHQINMIAQQEKQKENKNVKNTMDDAASHAMDAMQNLYKQLNQNIPENLEGEIQFNKKEDNK